MVDWSASLKLVGCGEAEWGPSKRAKEGAHDSAEGDARPESVREESVQESVRESVGKREEENRGGRGVFMDVEKAARLTRASLARSGAR